MDIIFLTGLFGSIVLVTGAAWPIEKKIKHPTKSKKNWLFAVGNITMFIYSILNYFEGGPIFFVFLEVLIVVSTILMMINIKDIIDTTIITICGLIFIIWSLFLFEGYNTIFFIIGLTGIGLGFAFKMGTLRRNAALSGGAAIIALFSYIEASWIFFWLNLIFALISGYYLVQMLLSKKKKKS